MPHDHVKLLSDHTDSSGRPGYEILAGEDLGDGRFRLLDSPHAVHGCARGDVIRVAADGRFELVEQGGRMSLQIFTADDLAATKQAVLDALGTFDVTLDNLRRGGFVVSVPISVGHRAIAARMKSVTEQFRGTQWQYGNAFPQSGADERLSWTRDFFER